MEQSRLCLWGFLRCIRGQWSGDHSTKGLWAYNWNLIKIICDLNVILIIQSGHNFAHVTTAVLSWHVQNCDLMGSVIFEVKATWSFQRFGLWAHKLLENGSLVLCSDGNIILPEEKTLPKNDMMITSYEIPFHIIGPSVQKKCESWLMICCPDG